MSKFHHHYINFDISALYYKDEAFYGQYVFHLSIYLSILFELIQLHCHDHDPLNRISNYKVNISFRNHHFFHRDAHHVYQINSLNISYYKNYIGFSIDVIFHNDVEYLLSGHKLNYIEFSSHH